MSRYLIRGGNALSGEVTVSGAKNSSLGILAAALMTEDEVRISNLPNISDISILLSIIEGIGAEIKRENEHTVVINAKSVRPLPVDGDDVRKLRGSYYLLGALLGRFGKASVSLPGGCDIGNRPIDYHKKGFAMLGAEVGMEGGRLTVTAEKLTGTHIFFDIPSVGATINIMLAAVRAEGKTVIENAAKEPHVVDVANFLNKMGANIRGAGTDIIKITGVTKLHGVNYSIIPDQLEVGTFMVAAAATKGDVTVKNVIPKHVEALTSKLIEMGARVEEGDDYVRVTVPKEKRLRCVNIKTAPYPGFPTDMQAQMTVLLTTAAGTSFVRETMFESRFKYVDELDRMGGLIKVEGNLAAISGIDELLPARVVTTDLRAGAALVIAGLMANGETQVDNIELIDRGYEEFDVKLRSLGADIERYSDHDNENGSHKKVI